ncbi:hypothetical protein ES705_35886 [subsurface metagenome]
MRRYISKVKKMITQNLISRYSPKYKLNYRNQGLINFIDVGSIGGLPDPWRSNANLVRFLLNFEPNESPSRGSNFTTYNTAVWEAEETLPFYIYKGLNATGSSLFKQNFKYVKSNYESLKKRGPRHLAETWFDRSSLVETISLKCRTLDNILREEFPLTPFHFLKIDAQGAEYNILKGSQSLLTGSCIGLHLELFTLPLYEGIVLLDSVEAYLSQFGFRMVKKFPAHGTFDSQHDSLFLKDQEDPALLSVIHKVYGINE